jgi:hypothetical protein
MAPIAKDGSLRCPAYLAFVRRVPCFACRDAGRISPAEPHHLPGRGAGGITRDDKTVPLCRACVIDGALFIDRRTQNQWVNETRSLFLDHATAAETNAYRMARDVCGKISRLVSCR